MTFLISCSNPPLDGSNHSLSSGDPIAHPPQQFYRGINMGGALEAPKPGDWGVTIEASDFKEIRTTGFSCIRIPVRFSAHADETPPYLINSDFMDEVNRIITQALEEKLTVILDVHHYDQMMTDPESHKERFLAIWDQIAIRFQYAPENLFFELLNEPSNRLDSQTWNPIAAQAITRIRKTNPSRKILIGSINYNHLEALSLLEIPNDENLIATFHFYEPFTFTHQGASWVPNSSSWEGEIWQGTPVERQSIQHQLDKAAAWSSRQQIPLIMGEFGAIRKTDEASRTRWIRFVIQEAEKRGISWILWDFCGDFGIYDCDRRTWVIDPKTVLFSND